MQLFLLLVVILLVAVILKWITFDNVGDKSSIVINKDKVRDDFQKLGNSDEKK